MRTPNSLAGKLRDAVAWESPVRTTSLTGQPKVTWADAGTQRCHVEAVTGSEKTQHDQPVPQHSHRVTIRSRTFAVAHDWRGVWVDRAGLPHTLNVVAIPPADTGDDWQVVLCQEQAATTAG